LSRSISPCIEGEMIEIQQRESESERERKIRVVLHRHTRDDIGW